VTAVLPTPGQTVGPFFRYGLEFEGDHELVPAGTPGAISLSGTVYDGAGDPVPDALVEIWHADADGAIPTAEGTLAGRGEFTGFGRAHVSEQGRFEFTTLEPDADFIAVAIFARGLMDVLHTRIYLPGREDAFLRSLTEVERATLVAARTAEGLELDIHLQGERETVFLDFR
jgi:protocatechuate 3,4-dioxygenase alpha subunit